MLGGGFLSEQEWFTAPLCAGALLSSSSAPSFGKSQKLSHASKTPGGMLGPASLVKRVLFTYLSIECRYIAFIDTMNVLATILAGCDGHDIMCNITVKGLFAD